jgi:hypothetical protein
VFFEEQGIRTATVISAEFVVPHPIQPLTREEVRALADKAFDGILARLTQ